MNRKPLTIFAACIAGAALLWCWFLLTREADPAPRRVHALPDRTSPPPDKTAAAAWPARGTPELSERLREPAARWLDSRGRDAAGLIAIWDLCGDVALLLEASNRFPDDHLVCRAMAEASAMRPDRAFPWIEKLIAAEPENPDGHYLKAWFLFATEANHGGIAALNIAVGTGGATSGPRNTHLHDRSHTLLLAAADLSVPDLVIGLAQIELFRDQDLNRRLYDRAAPALTEAMEKARQSGSPCDVALLATLAFDAVEYLIPNQPAAVSLNDEISANRFQRAILAHLGDEWTWQPHAREWRWDRDSGETAAELKLVAEKEGENLATAARKADLAARRLQSASEEVVVQYHRRYFAEGQRKADEWLLAQPAPATK